MKTTLECWLDRRGETIFRFARRMGIGVKIAYKIIGRPLDKRPVASVQVRSDVLERISQETGIAVGVLFQDAHEALRTREKSDAAAD